MVRLSALERGRVCIETSKGEELREDRRNRSLR